MNTRLVKANKEVIRALYQRMKEIFTNGTEKGNATIRTVRNLNRPVLLWSLPELDCAICFHRGILIDSIVVFNSAEPNLSIHSTDVLRIDSGEVGRNDYVGETLSINLKTDDTHGNVRKIIKRMNDEVKVLCKKSKVPVQDIFNPGGKVISIDQLHDGMEVKKKRELSINFF